MGKKKKKKEKRHLINLHPETRNGVLIILSLTLAVLSLLSYFQTAGLFGQYFLRIFSFLFGWGYFLIPLSFILMAIALFKSLRKDIYFTTILGMTLFILSFLVILEIIVPHQDIFSLEEQTDNKNLFLRGLGGGGYIGFLAAAPLLKLLGAPAALFVLISLVMISIIITFNISLLNLWRLIHPIKEKVSEDNLGPIKISNQNQTILEASSNEKESPQGAVLSQAKETSEDDKSGGHSKPQKEKSSENEPIFKPVSALTDYKLPSLTLLASDSGHPLSGDIRANANIIKRTLQNFNIDVEMSEVNIGPTVTQYTLRPAQGVKLAKITVLQNDLSLALAAHPLRIEAPIPGRSLVGIELPNKAVTKVRLKNLLEQPEFNHDNRLLTLALGRDVAGSPVFVDLHKMPHLLIAGATGTGKTICLNVVILSLLCQHSPDMLKFILIDPKRVEFPIYDGLPHLLSPVITEAQKTVSSLRWAVSEMERRFEVLSEVKCRDIGIYNARYSDEPLSYIVIVIDELADLMAVHGREIEAAIVRLAQMSRAVGIHLVVATQRPSVEVITGLIKANITSRVAFQVASQVDSRTILDGAGAEKLLGNGDMLFLSGDASKPKRIQGAYLTDKEVKSVVEYIKNQQEADYSQGLTKNLEAVNQTWSIQGNAEDDPLYQEAKIVVVQANKASASLLQRRLRIGYARAARLLDILEDNGIIGPGDGAKPREVYNNMNDEFEIS